MASNRDKELQQFVEKQWVDDCIPVIEDYIRIPNLSPYYDEKCLTNGHMDNAVKLIESWITKQNVQGLSLEVIQDKDRTPLIFVEIQPFDGASTTADYAETGTVLMYGHLDKQPPFTGWEEDLDPYIPVKRDGKLYGRGGADDGYSSFCAILSIKALQHFKQPHSRIVLIVEACEESGSPDLPHYVTKLKDRIGSPNLVVCLDSGAGNYEQLWVTSSLRGLIGGHLSAKIIKEGVHSGDASGCVPDTFRIMRMLLARIENTETGEIIVDEFKGEMSKKRRERVEKAVKVLGKKEILARYPFIPTGKAVSDSALDLALNRWWRPQLTITGQDGLPPCASAGNVLRPSTSLTLSLRLPPTVDAPKASEKLKEIMSKDPPYGAEITFVGEKAASGWAAPETADWLETALTDSSNFVFNKPPVYHSEGGSIPFMGMLSKLFPQAQFVVTGVLGPGSNAHGPNEFLHIDFSGKLTACVSLLLKKHFEAKVEKNLASNGASKRDADPEELTREYKRNKDGTKM